jgi:hypothetical protein
MVDRNSQQAIRLFVCKTDTAKVLGNCRPHPKVRALRF